MRIRLTYIRGVVMMLAIAVGSAPAPAAAQVVAGPDFGATWTNATFLAALQTLQTDLKHLAISKIDAQTAPGQWGTLKSDMDRLNMILNAQKKADAARAAQAEQQKQMQADIDHIQQLETLSDSTVGRNQKLDVLNKMIDSLLANAVKQRQLDLAKEQAKAAQQDALKASYMGMSGNGTFKTP